MADCSMRSVCCALLVCIGCGDVTVPSQGDGSLGEGDAGVVEDAGAAGDGGGWDDDAGPVDAALVEPDGGVGPPPSCRTRITFGSRYIRPVGVTSHVKVVDGMVTWGGGCPNDGDNSRATLSDGTTTRFRGRHQCVMALDYEGCEGAPSQCETRVHYGPGWLAPDGHPERYDDRPGVIGWNSNCTHSDGISRARLSNGWRPAFDAPRCQLHFRYTQCGGLYDNDVIEGCADPGVTYDPDGDRYILACTGGNFPIFVSRNLVDWRRRGAIFSNSTRPTWRATSGQPMFWAPEIHKVRDGRWVAYFSAANRSGRKSIGAAVADNPLGPFEDLGHPLVPGIDAGFIDASYIQDPVDGQRYLIYKYAGLATGERTPIYLHRLRPNGTETVGSRIQIFNNAPSSWEGGSVEGAAIMKRGDFYYLIYSGGAYNSSRYAVGVARSRSIAGPYTRHDTRLIQSNEVWTGPGHGSPVRWRTGGWWYVYHGWDRPPGNAGAKRDVLVDRMTWSGGWPSIGAAPSSMSMPPP